MVNSSTAYIEYTKQIHIFFCYQTLSHNEFSFWNFVIFRMKVFDLGEEKSVLVVKQDGKISAIGTKCSHYGAPLITGALGKGNVRCPWHGACFSLATGMF